MQFSGSPRITTPWFTFALSIILKSHRASSSGGRFEGFRQDLPRREEGRIIRTRESARGAPHNAQVVGASTASSCIRSYIYTHYNECGSFSLARPLFLPTNYESFLLLLKLLINLSAIGGSPGLVMLRCPLPSTAPFLRRHLYTPLLNRYPTFLYFCVRRATRAVDCAV